MALENPGQLKLLKRKPKYGNSAFRDASGTHWASKKEYRRWEHLRLLEHGVVIYGLRRQVSFKLSVNEIVICTYVADFTYFTREGTPIVEDAKGFKTPEYKLKKKLMFALLG